MKLCTVIGARPQFIKHAALEFQLSSEPDIEHIVIHTGQHFDANMSSSFFTEFNIKVPDYNLNIHSKKHGEQTAMMLGGIEKILLEIKPDFLIVYGDTNSTLAGALAAKKLCIKVIHIEAGLRSFNMDMPEEVNRVLTDRISNILFVPSNLAMTNLENEGLLNQSVLTGDIMKDMHSYAKLHNLIRSKNEVPYYYATIHRPYNTDNVERLNSIFDSLNNLDKRVIFSLHPRTKDRAVKMEIELSSYSNIQFVDPVPYFLNLNYIYNAAALLTDSGGMQKEAYWLKTKCVTIRKETEWTETLKSGWNHLVFDNLGDTQNILDLEPGIHDDLLYGNGRTAAHIIQYLKESATS